MYDNSAPKSHASQDRIAIMPRMTSCFIIRPRARFLFVIVLDIECI